MNLKADLSRLVKLQEELAGLAKAVLSLVEKGEERALDDAMARRSQLISRWKAARLKLDESFAHWPDALAALSGDDAAQCRRMLAEVKKSGLEILDWDRQAAQAMKDSRLELAHELARLKKGQNLLKAYKGGGNLPVPPRRISKSG